ncbi:MAG: hypothetical protein HOH62_04380, partial [Verrucomicrobia bacterium]|nr:hypothetical protein [Verrucomicrobiota bacterium]
MWEPSFILTPANFAKRPRSMIATSQAVKRRPRAPNALGQASGSFYSRLAKRVPLFMTDPTHDSPSAGPPGNPEVFNDVVVGIFRTTEDGRYIYANHRLAELYGYESPARLIEA